MLNDLQFVCIYLPKRCQRVDISQRYGLFSAELGAILVLLYPGRRKGAWCSVTAPLLKQTQQRDFCKLLQTSSLNISTLLKDC